MVPGKKKRRTMTENRNSKTNVVLQILRGAVLLLLTLMLILTAFLLWPTLQARFFIENPTMVSSPTLVLALDTPLPVSNTTTQTPTFTSTSMPSTPLPTTIAEQYWLKGQVILSVPEGGKEHLFSLLASGKYLRLTTGPWNDIHPAISPDGSRVAFASNRAGNWDLYLLELNSGKITPLTQSPEYEAHPSWSPDGLWIVYETLVEGNTQLDLFIRAVDNSQPPIRLTEDPASDHSPSWSPQGRTIAFVSTREGESDIWIADLDNPQQRFYNLSRNNRLNDQHPFWSPDGNQIGWSSRGEGWPTIMLKQLDRLGDPPIPLVQGDQAIWNPQNDTLLIAYSTPNQEYLSAFQLATRSMLMPALILPGKLAGMSWSPIPPTNNLGEVFREAIQLTPTPLWAPVMVVGTELPGKRISLIPLQDVQAPYAKLQDKVDEAFHSLRQHLAKEIGWDFLGSLEQAFLPLTQPLSPGMMEDWLYTGRAFLFDPAPLQAGWMKLVREDYGGLVFWRVYLKTFAQDGSQGKPLKDLPWNIYARNSDDPLAYEQGGAYEANIPEGYWFDFTQLALIYGWQRVPSLSSWRFAFSSIRFNEYIHPDGLDWFHAMLEVYPREALNTPTPIPTPTPTPTITLTPTRTLYLSPTPTPTRTQTPSPSPSATKTNP